MDPNLYAATIGAPAASPNVLGASAYNEISNLGAIDRKLPTSTGLANISLGSARESVDAQEQAAKQKIEELKQQAQDLADQNDPSKYTVKKKDDGGYDFFDPKGNQIDIATYTQKTGLKAADVLKDSENPIDIQYREDYKNLEDLINAIVNKDEATLDSYRQKAEAEGLPDISKMKPQQVIDQFKKYYQRYYTPRTVDPNAWGVTPNQTQFVGNKELTTTNFPSIAGGGL